MIWDWCRAGSGYVALALRSAGVLARMFLEHDVKSVTSDPNAELLGKAMEGVSFSDRTRCYE